jgi:hypothetical protein
MGKCVIITDSWAIGGGPWEYRFAGGESVNRIGECRLQNGWAIVILIVVFTKKEEPKFNERSRF